MSIPDDRIREGTELLDEAERLLEQQEFAGSVAAFRSGALLAPPEEVALTNLSVAEDEDRLEFRRRLARAFPDVLDVLLDEANTMMRAGYARQAVTRSTELLGRADWTPREVGRIRRARFEAATRARDHAAFADDFLYLWDWPVAAGSARKSRLWLLRTIVAISSPKFLDALESIRDRLGHEADLARLIDEKVGHLKILRDYEQG